MLRAFFICLICIPSMILATNYEECETPAGVIDPCVGTCILPKASPIVCNGSNLYVLVDFLYWTVREDGLGFAVSGQASNPGLQNVPKGKFHRPDTKWEPGFKAGAGVFVSCDGWDVTTYFTYLQVHNTKNTVSAPADPASTLRSTWATQDVPSGFTQNLSVDSASGKWIFKFNALDLEVGRNFYVSCGLALRPFFGAKGTWQVQDYDVVYRGIELSPNNFGRAQIIQKQWFTGGGVRVGLNTSWLFTKYFSLYGNVAASTLFGQFEIRRRNRQQSNAAGSNEVDTLRQFNRFHTGKGVLEFAMGLRGDIPIYCNRFNLRLQVGYEQQHWFSQNQFIKLMEEGAHGDLVMQGLTVEGRFDF